MMQLPRARSLAPTRLSRLPPEIWAQILDVATYVPYSLAPEILERSSLIGHPYNLECRAALWSALLTKGTIVRVCKQWWHIAIRYLYRAIYIRGTRDVLSLRRTLQRYGEGNGTVTEVEPLGWWTQRVDIVFDDTCTGVDEEALADIFKFLPNVAVFSGTFSNADSITYLQPTVRALLVGCASSLRVLDWSASDDNVPEARILRRFEGLVKDLPQLHTLNFPGLLQWPNGTITNSTLASIHTLCLRDLVGTIRFREQERRSLLNLRELVLYPPPRWEEPSWRNFLHHYGPYLTSVQLRAISNPGLISVYLPVVNQTCPNLRRLTLFVLSFSDISTSDILAFDTPPIEYLGLSVRRLQCRSMYEILFSALATLKEGLPTLHVVQLLDRQTVEDLLKYNLPLVSQAVEEGLIGDAFRLEDHDGNSLSDKLVEAGNTPN